MWTSDLSECWLNTPDVRSADDDVDHDVGGTCAASVDDLLHDFTVTADPSALSLRRPDVTFQTTTAPSATQIPLPVLQFCDTDASLVEQLVTPPVLKKTTQPSLNESAGRVSTADFGTDRPDSGPGSSTMFNSPLSEPRQEQFVLIQLPLNSDDLVALLSRVTNNNEFVVDNNSASVIHNQSEDHIATRTGADPCTVYQLDTSGRGETGNDVARLSEEDVLSMLDDAASIVVRSTVIILMPCFCHL